MCNIYQKSFKIVISPLPHYHVIRNWRQKFHYSLFFCNTCESSIKTSSKKMKTTHSPKKKKLKIWGNWSSSVKWIYTRVMFACHHHSSTKTGWAHNLNQQRRWNIELKSICVQKLVCGRWWNGSLYGVVTMQIAIYFPLMSCWKFHTFPAPEQFRHLVVAGTRKGRSDRLDTEMGSMRTHTPLAEHLAQAR